jgi:phospholipid transport system substrate-binding protein
MDRPQQGGALSGLSYEKGMMTTHHALLAIGRRGLLGLGVAASVSAAAWVAARADTTSDDAATAAVGRLDDALLAAMKAGDRTPFEARYRTLEPVIVQVFNLDAILATSVGLSWATIPEAPKAELAAAFRRYTVSSYVANFNAYHGQSFQVLPSVRAVGNGEVVVGSRLLRVDHSPIKLDYVMRRGPAGWQVVDVLSDGSISRVAVQRSDFRLLLASGGVRALTGGLGRKIAALTDDAAG